MFRLRFTFCLCTFDLSSLVCWQCCLPCTERFLGVPCSVPLPCLPFRPNHTGLVTGAR